ncbi:hypothetical protein GCM10020227_53790 [Streptomyces flavovirens]
MSATPWPTALPELEEARLFWLFLFRSDGRPHATPLLEGAGGALYFPTGVQARRVRSPGYPPPRQDTGTYVLDGLDIALEGGPELVRDPAELRRSAPRHRTGLRPAPLDHRVGAPADQCTELSARPTWRVSEPSRGEQVGSVRGVRWDQ